MDIGNFPKGRGIRLEVGKWYWWIRIGSQGHARFYTEGWHLFDVGFLKLREMPGEGEVIKTDFNIKFAFWLPIDRA